MARISGLSGEDETPVFVISVAAELAGMHAQTLRQYDRIGLVIPSRTRGGGRRYSAADVTRLREVSASPRRRGSPSGGSSGSLSSSTRSRRCALASPSSVRSSTTPERSSARAGGSSPSDAKGTSSPFAGANVRGHARPARPSSSGIPQVAAGGAPPDRGYGCGGSRPSSCSPAGAGGRDGMAKVTGR